MDFGDILHLLVAVRLHFNMQITQEEGNYESA
jgi:hypothetical protein